jgi:hypothetical protein
MGYLRWGWPMFGVQLLNNTGSIVKVVNDFDQAFTAFQETNRTHEADNAKVWLMRAWRSRCSSHVHSDPDVV